MFPVRQLILEENRMHEAKSHGLSHLSAIFQLAFLALVAGQQFVALYFEVFHQLYRIQCTQIHGSSEQKLP